MTGTYSHTVMHMLQLNVIDGKKKEGKIDELNIAYMQNIWRENDL